MAKILIIGGGVSGLSAGIYAQMSGHQAIICEKHKITGGNLTGWQRGEYHIDNCIHWLTGTNPSTDTYKIWEDLGALGNVDVFQGETLFTCSLGGKTLSLNKDLQKTRQDMLDISPQDAKETEALIRAVETMQGICGIKGERHDEKFSPTEKAVRFPSLLKYLNMTTGELAQRFKDPTLKFFIGSLLGDDFGALALIVVFATFCGGNGGIPQGGSLKMAERITERFLSLGGEIKCGNEVKKINLNDGKAYSVSLSDGSVLEADYFILTASPDAVFGKMLMTPMPKNLKKLYDSPRFTAFSAIHCAFSCDISALPFRGDLVFPTESAQREILHSDTVVIREFSHEKSFAPQGKTVLQALCFCKEDVAKNIISLRQNNKSKYTEFKEEIGKAFEKLVVGQIPKLDGKLTLIDVWTPATYRRFTGCECGAFMSFALPSRHLPLRMTNRIDGLPNVILATQWQQIPGGLPIAAEGGKRAIETVNKLEAKALHRIKTGAKNKNPDFGKAKAR